MIRFSQDDGSTHPVNKVILAAQSDFFETLFTFEDKTEYKIGDVTQEVLKIIIDIFHGKIGFDKTPEEMVSNHDIDMMLIVIAQAHYFQAPFLLKSLIKSLMDEFEVPIKYTFITWIDDISKTLVFARNFQIRELQIELETLSKHQCRCGNNGICYYCKFDG